MEKNLFQIRKRNLHFFNPLWFVDCLKDNRKQNKVGDLKQSAINKTRLAKKNHEKGEM